MARKILNEVAEYSRPFRTKIDIVDGVGIIRIADGAGQGN
jgi:hypothetical protein